MMKATKEYNVTTNNYVYNRRRKQMLEHTRQISCGYCRYHRCENSDGKWYGFMEYGSIKSVSRFPNWKLVSKNRKQWQYKKIKKKVSGFRNWSSGWNYSW